MMKHIVGQALFQLVAIMALTFTADSWVPEHLSHEEIPGYPGEKKYYSGYIYHDWANFKIISLDGQHMRSGRPYMISEIGEDYLRFEDVKIVYLLIISF